jgi:hypothetical protein
MRRFDVLTAGMCSEVVCVCVCVCVYAVRLICVLCAARVMLSQQGCAGRVLIYAVCAVRVMCVECAVCRLVAYTCKLKYRN